MKDYFIDLIHRSSVSLHKYKVSNIIQNPEYNSCISKLEHLYNKIMLGDCGEQEIKEYFKSIIKTYGTDKFADVLKINFDPPYIDELKCKSYDKYNILDKFFHPISYKEIKWTSTRKRTNINITKNKIVEDFKIVENSDNLDCFDMARTSNIFQLKVYGLKVAVHCFNTKKTLIIYGIIDEMRLDFINNNYIYNKLNNLSETNTDKSGSDIFKIYIKNITIKEILVYSIDELTNKYRSYNNKLEYIKQKPTSQYVQEFINMELYEQRSIIIILLLYPDNNEFQYLSYILYDLLSNDINGIIDTIEQNLLYDSLPWNIKKSFKNTISSSLHYTTKLNNYTNKILPLEQQICLLKVDNYVKEKAMTKLKEIKSKSDDASTKAKQYLDGLMKIPFGVYIKEEILEVMTNINHTYKKINPDSNKIKYTCSEINNNIQSEQLKLINRSDNVYLDLYNIIISNSNTKIKAYIRKINKINDKIIITNNTIGNIKKCLYNMLYNNRNNLELLDNIVKICYINYKDIEYIKTNKQYISSITDNISHLKNNIKSFKNTLDNSVYGHLNAKKQLERIIGQWINGENTGYCFGFEGPPGVGKTSFAKNGISKCLKNNGISRPFAFIAIGGSSNSSILDGHNYTYVGSTWGRIVDILIETKCMNPIIFIDELDKVSRTENGKEIIGILTHLVDPTQNSNFQDKYFSGINIDLSKVLFIFSYNDASLVDRILLDRIHRIKFEYLSLNEKIVIANKYIIPEITKNMGLYNIISISNEVISYIINTYTSEAGVRKLKEVLFEIIGDINLTMLSDCSSNTIPIIITEYDVRNIYLKHRQCVTIKKKYDNNRIGVVNGLWANQLGKGGILQIESTFCYCSSLFDLKLTGQQGDVMKESMSVAKSLVLKIIGDSHLKKITNTIKSGLNGIHIHCPDGGTPKDGPSAGCAISIVIHSLLLNKPVKQNIAITGEIDLQGNVMEIGGLDLKIIGAITAGIDTVIYPKANSSDFNLYNTRYNKLFNKIKFYPVETIYEIIEIVY